MKRIRCQRWNDENVYILFTYLLFFLLFCITGIALSVFGKGRVFQVFQLLCSWAPTFVLLVMARRLLHTSIKSFIKNLFSQRIRFLSLRNMLIPIMVHQMFNFTVGSDKESFDTKL